MNFHVKIGYITDRYHCFERTVTINPALGTVRLLAAGEHGDKGTCEKCRERLRFFNEALVASDAPHTWDTKREFLTLMGKATDIASAMEVLRSALLPTARSVEFRS